MTHARTVLTRNAPPATFERGAPPPSRGTRRATIAASSYDAATRSVDAVLSAGTAVSRYFGTEVLDLSPGAVDLARASAGSCPLLNAHNQADIGAVLGTVSNVRIAGGELLGRLTFADTDLARQAEGMVARGELRGISIGYAVRSWQLTESGDAGDTWTATSWELLEVSIVPVPADPAAGFRSAGAHSINEDLDDMLTRNAPDGAHSNAGRSTALATGAITARTITTAARNAGLDLAAVDEMLERHDGAPYTTDTLMAEIGQRYAARDSGVRTVGRVSGMATPPHADMAVRMQEALVARMSGSAPTERAREFMGVSMVGMARAMLEERGERVRFASDASVLERALSTTSDFPNLLTASGNRYLTTAYEAAESSLKALARQRSARDFRDLSVLQFGGASQLEKVGEGGEIRRGSFEESGETYRISTFAKVYGLSRQAIINDDLGAFTGILGLLARTAAEKEASELAALMNANGGLGPKMADGYTLFHAKHFNLGNPSAINIDALSAGRQAMRDQKDIDGVTPINAVPKTLLVGSANETAADQVLATINATKPGDANPFSGKLGTGVDPRLIGKGWRLFADPATAAVLEWAYLTGQEGPQLDQRQGWDVLGTEFRVVNDFGCAAVGWRGAWMNPGA